MQSIGENIPTNLLPSTKIFFTNTQSKTLEALEISLNNKKKDSIKASNNIKRNKQINDLLKK